MYTANEILARTIVMVTNVKRPLTRLLGGT